MEAYKELREKIMNKINLSETELLEVMELKKLNYQQYEAILEDLNICSKKKYEVKEKQENMRTKRINILRNVEMLSIVLLFVLGLGFFGNNIFPVLIELCGEALGLALGISSSLVISVLGVIGILKLDGVLCSKIIKKLETKREYKYLTSESVKYDKIIEFKSNEKDKKLNEYTKLVDKEKSIREKLTNDRNMVNLLETLIEEDKEMDNMEIRDNRLVRRRVKDNNE